MGQGCPGGGHQGPIAAVADITTGGLEQIDRLRIACVMKHAALAKLDEAVARTQALIAAQQERIDQLDAEGRDSSRHREFLESFKRLRVMQENWRQKADNCRNPARHNQVMTWSPRLTAPAVRREVA